MLLSLNTLEGRGPRGARHRSGGLGMLVFLRRWARDHNIRFLLFNPSKAVRKGLKRARSISEFYIPTMDEMMALVAYASSRHALAA